MMTGDDGNPFEPAPDAEVERDPLTKDIFGDTEGVGTTPDHPSDRAASDGAAYQVLARKYRPKIFEDLIGQEAMVRTLSNAFATGRIAHAFMLTGVRGVGKTTTARLLARALNYETAAQNGPSVDLRTEGRHCRAIIEGRHMDVLEMDAASRTKVDEMRELLDSVHYAPVEARYKVYIIDEVHMLSKAAFNALLKTLEEPPPHAKFIFATTEIRKVPVTILSRCQRFDLRRVEPDVLIPHLEKICGLEGARVEAEGLSLIARAAEGSVRDGLSLLDQALVQVERGQSVPTALVSNMLGLADRAATIALFEHTMAGRTGEAIEAFRALYGFGADPAQVMGDMMEHCHMASVAKVLGPEATRLPRDQAAQLTALGATLSAGTLSRVWAMLLKAFEEVRRAPDPVAAVEMALVRLCYAADLPGPEEALKRLQSGEPLTGGPGPGASGGGGGGGRPQAALAIQSAPALSPQPQSFDEVVALIAAKRDIGLKLNVERFVRLISFKPGVIQFEPGPGAPNDLARKIAMRLREWTGQPWMIAAEGGGGGESLYEREKRENAEARDRLLQDPFVVSVMTHFPGAEVLAMRNLTVPGQIRSPAETRDPSGDSIEDPSED